MGGLRAAAMNA